MKNVLIIDSCMRGQASRTRRLAKAFEEKYRETHPEAEVTTVDLAQMRLQPQYPEVLAHRDELLAAGRLDDPEFAPARRFAEADLVVVAAPFWDLHFPAALKIYLERICVGGITFRYGEHGESIGMCKAQSMVFISTRGGDFSAPELQAFDLSTPHLRAMCMMFGIPELHSVCAQGLDDQRNDPERIMEAAIADAEKLAAELA